MISREDSFDDRPELHYVDFRDSFGTPLTEEQVLLRKQVLYQAEREPDTFNQASWEELDIVDGRCATTRCTAGWAQYLKYGVVNTNHVERAGVLALGLTRREFGGEYSDVLSPLTRRALFYEQNNRIIGRLRELCEGL